MGLGGGGEGGTLVGRDGECRVAVLGEPGVGKNALVTRFVRGEFPMVRQNCIILSIDKNGMIFTQNSSFPLHPSVSNMSCPQSFNSSHRRQDELILA